MFITMRLLLVIDNDNNFLRQITTDLSGQRHRMVSTPSGVKGIEMAKTGNPDLLFLSMEMAAPNCFDIIREIKDDEISRNIPIIITVGNPDKADLFRAKEMGVIDFLVKPYKIDVLQEKLKRGLDSRFHKTGPSQMNTGSIKIAHSQNKSLISILKPLGHKVFTMLNKELGQEFFTKTAGNTYIMDLRSLSSLEDDALDNLKKITERFEGKDLCVVAGRHYGIMLAEGMEEKMTLFMSPEELKKYLAFQESQ